MLESTWTNHTGKSRIGVRLPGKRGFYVSAPLLGATLFLVAAVLAATVAIENEARIQVARSADILGKLQFMSQAILADSYNVLLQTKLEVMTKDFLERGYFDIDTQENDWKQSVKSNLQSYYIDNLGETLGLDIAAYAKAYSNVPGIDKCWVGHAGDYQSTPTTYDSSTNDGSIMVMAASYGERIECDVREPEGHLSVDILGRAYRVNIRVAKLYDTARWVILTTKGALNSGITGVPEPVASWSSSRWIRIKKTDNIPVNPQDSQNLQAIIEDWSRIMKWLGDRIISISNNYLSSSGLVGISLRELDIEKEENGKERGLMDFDISCAGEKQYRNCMPFRLKITLGDADCSKGGEPVMYGSESFYHLAEENRWWIKCGASACPQEFNEIMYQILKPIESVCVDYFAYVDSVYPVCRKWIAKEKSLTIKGVVEDDHEDYLATGSEHTQFRFKDQQPNVDVTTTKKNRLRCDKEGIGELKENDINVYKNNVIILLENIIMKFGVARVPGSSLKRWVDKGSVIRDLDDPTLKQIYKNIYGQGVFPKICFMGGIASSDECKKPEMSEKPQIEIWVDWDETRENCINMVDKLCQTFYNDPSLTAVPEYTETFCRNLFPRKEDAVGGYGRLRCAGKGDGIYIEIGPGDTTP